MESRLIELEKHRKRIDRSNVDIQFRSTKNNLTFHNVPERRQENVFLVLNDYLVRHLKIDPSKFEMGDPTKQFEPYMVWIARCHIGSVRRAESGRTALLWSFLHGGRTMFYYRQTILRIRIFTYLPNYHKNSQNKEEHPSGL